MIIGIGIERGNLRRTKWHEYATRFVFGGAVTVLAGLIAKKFGAEVGGLFLAFPAIFPAGATMIEKHETNKKARHGLQGTKRGRLLAGADALGAAIGSVGLVCFATLTWKLLPSHSTWVTLSIATMGWFGIAISGWLLQKRL